MSRVAHKRLSGSGRSHWVILWLILFGAPEVAPSIATPVAVRRDLWPETNVGGIVFDDNNERALATTVALSRER
jgi:hypothetical protein